MAHVYSLSLGQLPITLNGKLDLEREKKKGKKEKTTSHTWEAGINTPVSLLPFVKLFISQSIQTYISSIRPPLGVSHPNHPAGALAKGLMRCLSGGPENVSSLNFPCTPLCSYYPGPAHAPFPPHFLSDFTGHQELNTKE